MVREYLAVGGVAVALAGPAITMAAFGPEPRPITPTDLRGPAAQVRLAVGTWGADARLCAAPPVGAEVLHCADGLTSARR